MHASATKDLVFRHEEDWVLLVHSSREPNDSEWAEYVGALQSAVEANAKGLLVFTDGGGPNATQRKQISDVKIRTAVVTQSRVARGIVTALGWVGVEIRAFSPEQIMAAFGFLNANDVMKLQLLQSLANLRASLAGLTIEPSSMSESEIIDLLTKSLEQLTARA